MPRHLIALCLAVPLAVASAATASAATCDKTPPIAATSAPPKGTKALGVTLTPDTPTEVVNFGPGRGTKDIDIVLNASAALPAWFTAGHLEVDVPRRLRRVGENLQSVTGSAPTLSAVRIGGHKRVVFTVCIDGSKLPAGRYSGLVTVDGPAGIETAAVAITANAKNGVLWWWGFGGALLVALVVLFYRGAADRRTGTPAPPWRTAAWGAFTDPTWWASSLVSLGAAFGTVYAIYAGNPAWGEDGPAAVFALIGATLTAAGVQSFLATFRQTQT
jgi:hypothetical protein